jgi:ribosomal protein S14
MGLDADLLASAEAARDRLLAAQHAADQARADYHHAVRRLHAAGGTLREIAAALRLSHQRVHQIIEELPEAAARRRWLRRQRRRAGPAGPCSFCGRPRAAVARLVAGPGVCICDGCVAAAGRAGGEAPGDPTRPSLRPEGQGRCSFCGRPAGQVRRLVGSARPAAPAGKAGGPARICDQCLALCEEILGEAAWP